MKLERDHSISTWLSIHPASTINRFRVGLDGKTAHQHVTGKKFERPVVELGEVVWALRPKSRGINKLDYIWYEGVWVGVVNKSGENIVLTEEGATRTPHVRRMPEGEDRCNIRGTKQGYGGYPGSRYQGRARSRYPLG